MQTRSRRRGLASQLGRASAALDPLIDVEGAKRYADDVPFDEPPHVRGVRPHRRELGCRREADVRGPKAGFTTAAWRWSKETLSALLARNAAGPACPSVAA